MTVFDRRSVRVITIALAAALLFAQARARAQAFEEAPRSSISVLVDLSGTWNNTSFREENYRILEDLAKAIVRAAGNLPQPVHVKYFVIGDSVFLREPRCEVIYQGSMFGGLGGNETGDRRLIRNKGEFEIFLIDQCVRVLINTPPEPWTDIVAALESAIRSEYLMRPDRSSIIVLSDLVQDRASDYELRPDSLVGRRILLLYRALASDSGDIRALVERERYWIEYLNVRGAQVCSAPDKSTPVAVLARYLAARNWRSIRGANCQAAPNGG